MKLLLSVLVHLTVISSMVDAFQPPGVMRRTGVSSSSRKKISTVIFSSLKDPESHVDMLRAKECAENFGLCSVEEMKQIHDALHNERLQNFMFGGHGLVEPSEDALQHRFLEEELELQLGLLQDHDSNNEQHSTLFPPEIDSAVAMQELPHLTDTTDSLEVQKTIRNAERELIFEETFLEEGILETLAMCLTVAFLVLLPQLLHI